jgi:multidrug resistance efflux pump
MTDQATPAKVRLTDGLGRLLATEEDPARLWAEIHRLRAELQHARDGLTKGRTRMREDLERHKPLVQAVEWLVEEGHMYVEDLARLRAALDGLRPNVRANRPSGAAQE